jgi:hypothetical protein
MTTTPDCNTKSPTETITISSSMFHSFSTHNVNSKVRTYVSKLAKKKLYSTTPQKRIECLTARKCLTFE